MDRQMVVLDVIISVTLYVALPITAMWWAARHYFVYKETTPALIVAAGIVFALLLGIGFQERLAQRRHRRLELD